MLRLEYAKSCGKSSITEGHSRHPSCVAGRDQCIVATHGLYRESRHVLERESLRGRLERESLRGRFITVVLCTLFF